MILWLLFGVFVAVAVILRIQFTYWKRRGFPWVKANFPFGCLGPMVQKKLSFGELIRDIHLESEEPLLGIYLLFRPALLIRDAELVKRVLITDFEHFADRGFHYDEENDPIGANITGMPFKKWKQLRSKLSPIFAPVRVKKMFPVIEEKTEMMKNHLDSWTKTESEVELKSVVVNCNVSIMASTFFGFELDAFAEPDHEFAKIGRLFFEAESLRSKLTNVGFVLCPDLLKWLKIPFLSPEVAKYSLNLVKSVIAARKAESPSAPLRHDFIEMVLNLMEDTENGNDNDKSSLKFTIEMVTAQAFLFYAGGYDTSSTTTALCIYELSKNPEWMARVRKEVDGIMEKRNGKLEYEDLLMELKSLDLCIKETMRMYPPLSLLNRECTKEYLIPGTDRVIAKGTPIIISNFGLHMEERFYPNAKVFNPARFEDSTDLPFYTLGAGPRNCIGAKMGQIMIQLSLCSLIHYFDFEAIDKEIKLKPGALVLTDINHTRMKIRNRFAK